jgi:hypothetical protein
MKPWTIRLKFEDKEVDKSFSPDYVCGELITQLVGEFAPKDSEDYGLYFEPLSDEGFWLEETAKLYSYHLYKLKVISLAEIILDANLI